MMLASCDLPRCHSCTAKPMGVTGARAPAAAFMASMATILSSRLFHGVSANVYAEPPDELPDEVPEERPQEPSGTGSTGIMIFNLRNFLGLLGLLAPLSPQEDTHRSQPQATRHQDNNNPEAIRHSGQVVDCSVTRGRSTGHGGCADEASVSDVHHDENVVESKSIGTQEAAA